MSARHLVRSSVALSLVAVLACAGCNSAPEGLAVVIEPELPRTLDALVARIDTAAVDPQDDAVTYTYSWRRDGEDTSLDQAEVPSGETAVGEVWSVVVVPTDGKEFGASATAEVSIQNTPPEVSLTLSPAAPSVDDDLVVSATVSDPDGQPTSLTYAWLVDGSPQDERTERIDADRTVKGQVWEVVVTANDGIEDGPEARASVTVGNSAPSFESASIEPAELHRGMTATCVGTGWADADGDAEGAQVRWTVDGTEVSTEAELVLGPYPRGSVLGCELTPFDGEDAGAAVLTAPVTLGNAPPSVGDLSIGPEDPPARTTITSTVTDVVDLDGDEVSLKWTWTVNGVEQGSLDSLPGTRFVGGQRIQATVVPSDGTDDGEAVQSNILDSVNTPPVISDVSLDPVDPATDEAVVATVTAADVDGDAVRLSYAWYVEGSLVSGATGDTLEGDDWFDKHDEIYVTVTPSDTESGSPVTSDTAIAVNTPPPSPEISFSPEDPDADEDVVCTVSKQEADLDGDSITYTFAWTLDGSPYTKATTTTYTGDTIPASARSDEDAWVCIVTPHDGDDDGPDARRSLGEEPVGFDTSGSLSSTALRGGSMPGTTTNEDCPSGSFLVGLSGDLTGSGGYFAELAARCAPMTFDCSSSACTVEHGSITTGTYRGGSGRFLVNRDCPTGSVVTGFTGRAGWYLDQITLRCAPITVSQSGSTWSASLGTGKDVSPLGGSGGGAFSRADCSSGQAATRARIRASTGQVDGFGLACQSLVLEVE